jgi:hypothetical protein
VARDIFAAAGYSPFSVAGKASMPSVFYKSKDSKISASLPVASSCSKIVAAY